MSHQDFWNSRCKPGILPSKEALEIEDFKDVFIPVTYWSFFLNGVEIAKMHHTHHPTIPYEVTRLTSAPSLNDLVKRVHSEKEAIAWLETFVN